MPAVHGVAAGAYRPSPTTCIALARALVKSGGRSEEAFAQLLTSGDRQVREAAVRGLAGREAFSPWPWP